MSDNNTGDTTAKVIRVLGLSMFWLVWVYGFICMGVMARYKEALTAGYKIATGQSETMTRR